MSEMNVNPEDTFRILLATDCHLGYLERDAVRGQDSLVTFEEILQIALDQKVDFILLGGDLFHENKPSRRTLYHCMQLLRKYCMGENPIQFQFTSDQSKNFHDTVFPIVNYEDPNLNLSLPVFSIHGNHDDPAGAGSLCTLDLLSVSGLVNYFGKCTDLNEIHIAPLLFRKGQTKLALFGLGSIRDERLHRLFREDKVKLCKPGHNPDEWFNMFTIHQNRSQHGPTNYIPERFLDSMLDLVVWGHEHECRLVEELNREQCFYVTQPGSSVATSLCHGEAVMKHVGLLQVFKKSFKITEIPLKTVRQFYIKDIDLENVSLDLSASDKAEKVMEYCKETIDRILQTSLTERSGHSKQPEKPLIRLRIFHPVDFETFSVQRFGQSYVDKVANPKDIILFSRKKVERVQTSVMDVGALKTVLKRDGIDKSRVEDLVKEYFFRAEENKKLSLLSEFGISNAVCDYVVKEDSEAINLIVNHQLNKVQTHLKEKEVEKESIDDEISSFRRERQTNSADEISEFPTLSSGQNHRQTNSKHGRGASNANHKRGSKNSGRGDTNSDQESDDSTAVRRNNDETTTRRNGGTTSTSSRGDVGSLSDDDDEPFTRNKGGATRKRGGTTATRKRNNTRQSNISNVDDMCFNEVTVDNTSGTSRGRGQRSRGRRRAASTSVSTTGQSSSSASRSVLNDTVSSKKSFVTSTWKSPRNQTDIKSFFREDSDFEYGSGGEEKKEPTAKKRKPNSPIKKGVHYESDSDSF